MLLTSSILVGLLALVYACPEHEHEDGHLHDHARRAVPSSPLTPPSRALDWGDINILHTTDSHGWLLGHQKTSFPEPNYRCVDFQVKADVL